MFQLTEEQKKKGISQHVQGELDMFLWAFGRIDRFLKDNETELKDGSEKRAIHECFLLHARNLSDFLWDKERPAYDDILAACYSVELTRPSDADFKMIFGHTGRINKQLSHITFSREDNMDLLPESPAIFGYIMNGIKEYNGKQTEEKYRLKISNSTQQP